MSGSLYPVPQSIAADARVTAEAVARMRTLASADPDAFWREQA